MGPQGPIGPSPLDPTLAHICAISWPHAGQMSLSRLRERRFLEIAFDRPVRSGDIDDITFMVLVETLDENRLTCWCQLRPERVQRVRYERECDLDGGFGEVPANAPDDLATGARYEPQTFDLLRPGRRPRVIVQGDLIRDDRGRGCDLNHLPPWVPQRRTGDGIEGGVFESWFRLTD